MEHWILLTVVAFFTGVTASMGLGGGFILILWLTVLEHVPQLAAQGINLIFFLPIAAVSLFFHIKNKLVEKKVFLPAVLCELAGVFLGVWLANRFGSDLLRKIFAWFVLAVGIRELLSAFWMPKGQRNSVAPVDR